MGSQPSSFANIKDLRFVFTLANDPGFVSNGQSYNTITLQGLRASVYIDNAGGYQMGVLRAQIFGISESDLNTLTSPQWTRGVKQMNAIQVFAIDGDQETLVYNGEILNCWGVYTSMPQVYLYVEAQIGYAALVMPVNPLSVSADSDIDTVMSQIAKQMGFSYENNGVKATVPKGTYLGNTAMEQARTLMQSYQFWMYIDTTSPNTMVIVPQGSGRQVAAALIAPETGLQGYPMFNTTGIVFETLLNPNIVFGGPVEMRSSVPQMNGSWVVTSMAHQLLSQTHGGQWKTTVNAISPSIWGNN
jgi:hypothetical protein